MKGLITFVLAAVCSFAFAQEELVVPDGAEVGDVVAVEVTGETVNVEVLSDEVPTPVAEDQLIRDLNVSAQTAAPEIVTLELAGKIRRQAGGLLALA